MTAAPASQRPWFHLSVPDNWKNDPQRPIFLDGEYHYYYLYNADYLTGGAGTAWRRATTRDHVVFRDEGVAIPKFSDDNGDCWSGSLVVDEHDTAGFGAGAVIALVTQAPGGVQGQYLWVSVDGGRSFTPGGTDPVLPNPGVPDFRDPKVIWDAERSRWFLANAEGRELGFYTSPDLQRWERVGSFVRDDIGLLECPDLFRLSADDGTDHWVLGTSANGTHRGLPPTYAYWTGAFDGVSFTPDHDQPRWLDHGFDFYGAVTYAHHDDAGLEDPHLRHALGWANFWDYPHNTPTLVTDGYNGDDMIVRDLTLRRVGDGYALASAPTAALADHVTATHRLGDIAVDDTVDLDVRALAYDLTCEVRWNASEPPTSVGLEVCRAPGGGRRVSVELTDAGTAVAVDRRETVSPAGGRTVSPIDAPDGRVRLRLLVDRTSVEVFVGDGVVVHSHRVFPLTGDDGIRLFTRGAPTVFGDVIVREIDARPSGAHT
ncbi:glycoside hydrolase family 32 protein [Microbacterium aurantiacum]|uniref:glycoside hydrolase family 32 protein n=1 Tax=Microbacterium aurantiacum TaxID=162393 RepID=UPI0040351EED